MGSLAAKILLEREDPAGRYLLYSPTEEPDYEAAWHGQTAVTADAEGGMEFWIPKGANRFHFVGGARFIHGGAMLQEIVVPVVTVRQIKGKSVVETRRKPVPVQVLGGNHKVTTPRHRFELIQMEPVSDRVKAITLKVSIHEGGEPVTNVAAITFDSASEKLDERKQWVSLVLRDREYNKKTPFRCAVFRRVGKTASAANRRAGQHEPGRQYHPR